MKSPVLLRQAETLLGTLVIEEGAMPWWYGRFEPTADFEPVRPVFDAWSRAVGAHDEAAMDPAYRALKALDLTIAESGAGEPVGRFLLYIDGDRFRLRY